jgi:hypothetical protein
MVEKLRADGEMAESEDVFDLWPSVHIVSEGQGW